MKRIKIIARQHIIDPHTGKLHNDQGLKVLNGYYESEIIEVEDLYDRNTVILNFEKLHPDIKADTYEICGLKWEDFDAENGKLKVRRSVAKRKGGGLNIGETKTEAGTRTIVLPPSTAELLRKRKETAVSEWIFPNIYEPEKPMHPDYAYHRLKTLLKQAELPLIRFHDLRHTFATHALAGGVDAKTLSGILGHTNASFTLDTYTHVTTDMQRNASTIVGSFMDEIMLEGDDTNR